MPFEPLLLAARNPVIAALGEHQVARGGSPRPARRGGGERIGQPLPAAHLRGERAGELAPPGRAQTRVSAADRKRRTRRLNLDWLLASR